METIFGKNFKQFSNKNCILGIDEAGRGPVLGPMVYSCGICLTEHAETLKGSGVDDSKALTEEKREELFNRIEKGQIIPRYISNRMLRRSKYSLNEISHTAAIDLVKICLDSGIKVENLFIFNRETNLYPKHLFLVKGDTNTSTHITAALDRKRWQIKVDEVYVDTVGPPDTYQAKLCEIFPGLSITVSKKADSLYPVVSAASICAKVTRDRLVKNWNFPESGCDFSIPENGWGSGYPADPDTKGFMENCVEPVFGYPSLVRFSWATADSMLQKKAVNVKWEDENEEKTKTKSLLNFFSKKNDIPVVQRQAYFVDRKLYSATKF